MSPQQAPPPEGEPANSPSKEQALNSPNEFPTIEKQYVHTINRLTGHVVSVDEIDPATGERTRVPLDYHRPLAARAYAYDPYGYYGYHPGVEDASWSDPAHPCHVPQPGPAHPCHVSWSDPAHPCHVPWSDPSHPCHVPWSDPAQPCHVPQPGPGYASRVPWSPPCHPCHFPQPGPGYHPYFVW
jgi:hypothetical protein